MDLRYSIDGRASGARNMKRDRELFQRAEEGELRSPFLRVYAWDPPAVSLGFHQPEASIDPFALRRGGYDLVRRPTGGAAVLHAEEITYCLVAPLSACPGGSSARAIYDVVADALVRALRACGVAAERAGEGRPTGFACFASAGGHEIVVGGRKLLGSALRKGRRSFLVHGSLLTGPQHRALAELIAGDPRGRAEATALVEATTDLSELGVTLEPETWGRALAAALGEAFGATTRD